MIRQSELGTAMVRLGSLSAAHRQPLPGSDFGVWTFMGTNRGGSKIKVAKSTEERILSILTLWYYANRMIALERQEEPQRRFSAKGILAEFEKKGSRSAWPGCDGHFVRLYKAFDVQGLHGKDVSGVSEKTPRRRVLDHFRDVMSVGILDVDAISDTDDGDGTEATPGRAPEGNG